VRSAQQVDGIIGAGDFQLSDAEFAEIESAVQQEAAKV
jgi:aryl-alcohol dehydrogenase-like predicted oxidoreductase